MGRLSREGKGREGVIDPNPSFLPGIKCHFGKTTLSNERTNSRASVNSKCVYIAGRQNPPSVKLLYPAMKDENDKWIASAFAFIGSFDSEVSGREADSIPPPEEARLKKLASGQAGLSERHDIIQWLSENPAALHRFA